MIRRPPRSTQSRSSAASDVYKRQPLTSSTFLTIFMLSFHYYLGGNPFLIDSTTSFLQTGNQDCQILLMRRLFVYSRHFSAILTGYRLGWGWIYLGVITSLLPSVTQLNSAPRLLWLHVPVDITISWESNIRAIIIVGTLLNASVDCLIVIAQMRQIMSPGSFSQYPAVYHIKNRYLLIGISIFLIVTTVFDWRSGSWSPTYSCLLWIGLFAWSYLLMMAILRRLVISSEGLEYTSELSTIRARWSEVKAIVKRRTFRTLWWTTEGLVIYTDVPDSKEYFLDLLQFGRRWRQEPLGATLQMKAPHLFSTDGSN